MAEVWMTESRQAALSQLLSVDPVPGRPLPLQHVLELINQLVPCDLLCGSFTDAVGHTLGEIVVAPTAGGRTTLLPHLPGPDHADGDGPYYLGWIHWTRNPHMAEGCVELSGADELAIGFRNGVDHVVQYGFVRETSAFAEEELALLRMITPALGRLARERPTPATHLGLTPSERRVLSLVATGRSNADIAESLCVAESTVRKHLENSYRKLGVSSRMAAVARLGGAEGSTVDLRGRLEIFA